MPCVLQWSITSTFHSTLIATALTKNDKAASIEAMLAGNADRLTNATNLRLVELETALDEATSDDNVKAQMRSKWGGRTVTVRVRDGVGGFVTRTFPDLALLGGD